MLPLAPARHSRVSKSSIICAKCGFRISETWCWRCYRVGLKTKRINRKVQMDAMRDEALKIRMGLGWNIR